MQSFCCQSGLAGEKKAMNNQNLRIGFIGTGVMGSSMAAHLLAAGYPVQVFNRTRAKAEPLLQAGAVWAISPASLAASSDVIITIVGYPQDVESLYFGMDGLLENAAQGCTMVDMTTSCPALAKRIATEAAGRGLGALDAPVSGGDKGAREATLSIMVGGEAADFDRVLPVFRVLGKNIVLQGPAGSGQFTKLCNQIVIAGGMVAICEALGFVQKAGLNLDKVLSSISGGAAGSWSLSNLAPRMLKGDFAPGFYVKHFNKDMRIALESAGKLQADTPALRLAADLYNGLAESGSAELGTQALFKEFCPIRPAAQ